MDYKPMYFTLFNGLTDALDALNRGDISQAKEMLILAQQEGEEIYMQNEETDGQP